MRNRNPKKRGYTKTLFFKYLRFTFSLVLASILILMGIYSAFLVRNWTNDRRDTLTENAKALKEQILLIDSSDYSDENSDEAKLLVEDMLRTASDTLDADIFVADTDGSVKICGDKLEITESGISDDECATHDYFKLPTSLLEESKDGTFYSMTNLGGPYENKIQSVVRVDIVENGKLQGYLCAIAPSYDGLGSSMGGMLGSFAVAALIALIVAAIISYFFANNMTKPLNQMIYLTSQYAKGDFSERIEVKSEDELQDLASSLNNMAETLSEVESSRRSFVANVSHELKTPMTTIGGFVDGILDGTISKEHENRYLKTVSSEIKRLQRLVVTMLTLSKIEAGEETLHYTRINMNQLLFEALFCFEKQIDEQGFSIEGFENLPEVEAYADRDMMFQVLYNLFDNAVKFTNQNGTIKVELDELNTQITVKISNTGKGIPEEEVRRVFERFYKVDKSRSEYVKGVGLGLNLAQNIVWLHGGEIYVKSRPYSITTFSFWIPKKNPELSQE